MNLKKNCRIFGLSASFLVLFGVINLWFKSDHINYYFLTLAVTLFITSLVRPTLFTPLVKIWIGIGNLMHRITNPLLLGIIFYVFLTPTGFLSRLIVKKINFLPFDKSKSSYWQKRSGDSSFFEQY